MMNMNQLFKALPRDLQWEILSEFVGTHVVRNGKLRRKIVYCLDQYGSLWSKVARVRQHYDWDYSRPENIRWHIRLTDHQQMKFYEDDISGDTIYGYKILKDNYYPVWELHFPAYRYEDPVILLPFVKNVYKSYPYTDKKKALRTR